MLARCLPWHSHPQAQHTRYNNALSRSHRQTVAFRCRDGQQINGVACKASGQAGALHNHAWGWLLRSNGKSRTHTCIYICVCTYMHVCVCACHMQGDLTLPVWAPLPALDVHTLHTYLCICYSCPPKHRCIYSTRQQALLCSRGIAHGVGCVQRTLQSICRWCCRSEYV